MSLVRIHKGKLHCARVKQCDLHYSGSVTIDQDLMEAAGMLPMEFVHIWNKDNGSRIETYTIPGERGSGMICINGAAARNYQYNDQVIIASYRQVKPELVHAEEQRVVVLDQDNRATRIFKYGLSRPEQKTSLIVTDEYAFNEIDVKFHYRDVGGKQRIIFDEKFALTPESK